jgi:RNA polymerase sigma-70 factor (ECF subfamily)
LVDELTLPFDEIFRREAAQVLATLIRLLGDFDLAEEARQEAYAAALNQWPANGIPDRPAAWLISAGRYRIVDRLRRDQVFRSRIVPREIVGLAEPPASEEGEDFFGDDRLRLIFTCCHPALNAEARVALTLREVCGLSTPAVARAFLVSEDTMAQRLVRAKKKIREARIPYETPEPAALDQRIEGVLNVVYSVFTEGYAATAGDRLIDVELCAEAERLGALIDALLPDRAAVLGLNALMLLHDARRAARVSAQGELVLLEDQDRRLFDGAKIAAGLNLVERALSLPQRVSSYTVQAAIAALHVRAASSAETDWPQIVGLYEVLLRLESTPVVELNHAVALSMVEGPARALDLLDSLAARGTLDRYHLLHAARGRFLSELGRCEEAREAYCAALSTASLDPERRFLTLRLEALGN